MKQERRLATALKNKRLDWQLQKRKLHYHFLTNFGKNFASPDDDYEQHEQRFIGLLQKLLDIRKSLEHYRTTALPIYCSACASLGADVWCVVSVDAVGKGADAEKFRHAMCAINETKEVKNHFFNADEVLAGALRFLDIHINAMKSVKSQIGHRKRVKLDFDCYERKLSKLKEAKAVSAQRLERNESKLQKSREMLRAVTFDLYRVFAKYESERDTMLNGELEMVRQVMHSFYAKNAEATDFVIPEEVDRAALDAKTDQIFKTMVAKELEKQSVKELPAPANEDEDDEAQDGVGPESYAANGSDSLPSPPGAMVVPAPVLQLTHAATSAAPLPTVAADLSPSAHADENNNSAKEEKEVQQPEHEATDDELSEKLKTIQLTRPNVQPLKHSRWRSSACDHFVKFAKKPSSRRPEMAEVTAAPMDRSSPEAAASTTTNNTVVPYIAPNDAVMRRLSMSSSVAGDDDHDRDDDQEGLPSVHDLLQVVAQLQGIVREIGPNDGDAAALFDDDESPFTIYRSPNRGPRYYVDPRSTLKHHASAPNLAQGIYDPRKRGTSVVSALSPQKDPAFYRTGVYGGSGLITPPPKRRELSSVPRPTTRVAALTRENISLLPTPQDYARRRNTAGSISGMSQQSKTSVRTDGGAVFSRLYQSDYHKNRDQKLRAIRDRQENLNLSFAPRTNAQRTSISSRDSVGSSSIGSMQSAKTDITGVSSRLYDPDYVRKRNARLNRMREERELRNCTFAPAINTASTATLNPANGSGAATPNRRASSIHLNLKS